MSFLLRTGVVVACLGVLTGPYGPAAAEEPREAATRSRNEGYGLFYELLSSLRDTDKILTVKFESEPLEAFAERLAATADRLASRLEAFDEGDMDLRLDKTGLPEVERRSREAIRESQIERMAPLIGESGAPFERMLLLGHLKALDQLRHMAPVLLELERVDPRRKFLNDAAEELERLHTDLERLLEERYFCEPARASDSTAKRDES